MEDVENLRFKGAKSFELAKKLWKKDGAWGMRPSARRVGVRWIGAKRRGCDLIDVELSARHLLRGALECGAWHAGSGEILICAPTPRAARAADMLGLGQDGRTTLAAGRWKPGSIGNWPLGEHSGRDVKALVALGRGVEIALREARAAGIPSFWIGDTDSRPELAAGFACVNASRPEALAVALKALLGL